jgi:membrane-associated phospholipid phosphatase
LRVAGCKGGFKNSGRRKTTGNFPMKKFAPVWKRLLFVLLAVFAVAAAFHFDSAVRAWVLAHPNRAARNFMRAVSRYGDWPEHVIAGLVLVAVAWGRGSKRWARVGLTMILACALAGIAARGVKIATGRARPSVRHELRWTGPQFSQNYNSFPSGHTAASVAFFGVLFCVDRRLALCLSPIPLLIAGSRMYVAAHYLSDVVCGALLGIFCAWLCAKWLLKSSGAREA